MGGLKKIGKSFKKGLKSIGKATKQVFKSNIFKFATSALSMVPGLNAVGLIGKGISLLGKTSSIQKFLKTGLSTFKNLKKGFKLNDAVKSLVSSSMPPLGKLAPSGIQKALAKPAELLKALKPHVSSFREMQELSGRLQKLEGNLLPQQLKYNKISAGPGFLKDMDTVQKRMQHVSGMFQELLRHLGGSNKTGANQIIRA